MLFHTKYIKAANTNVRQDRKSSFFKPAVQPKLTINQPHDIYEQEADAMADSVMRMPDNEKIQQSFFKPVITPIQRRCAECEVEEQEKKMQRKETNRENVNAGEGLESYVSSLSGGQSLPDGVRSFYESGFNYDFSSVRVHTNNNAAKSAESVNAIAYTYGNNIVFNSAKYSPETDSGKRLLSHELTHVVQQKGNNTLIQRTVSDAEAETELNKWADAKKTKIDKNDDYYPHLLWDFVYSLTHDSSTYMPISKPTDAAKLKIWQHSWEIGEVVAKWLFALKASGNSDAVKSAAESRANGVLDAMVRVNLINKAIAQAGSLDPSNKKTLFENILKRPDAASASELETVTTSIAAAETDPGNMEVVQNLINTNLDPVDKLNADKSKAILKALLAKFPNSDTLVDAIATLMMMNPAIRASLANAMYAKDFGSPDLLFKIFKHKYFVEPGYAGGALIGTLIPPDVTNEDYDAARHKNDMPFVYKYKQKYYVQYLIDLAASQSIIVPAPATIDFAGLKAWLDINTNKIGDAAKLKYPSDPDAVIDIYKNIADIFFYHPDDHSIDISPDQSGGIGHLKEAKPVKEKYKAGTVEKERYVGPSASRMAADCDVYATYAMRLFTHAGFEPIGYLGIKPKGADTARAAHAAALIRKDKTYYVINNKGILTTGLSDDKAANDKKPEALKILYKKALEDAYAKPYPTDLDVYYEDADATGRMGDKFRKEDTLIFRNDLK